MTTAIAYTSGKPHIGNTYEIVLADSIARYRRMQGYDVFFQTGTDEHGQKIELKAEEAGVTPKEFVDNVSGQIKNIWDLMNTSYDKFIRTTDDYHVKQVQKIFKRLYDQGDIYKGYYEGMDIGEIWGYEANDLFLSNREVDAYLRQVDLSFFKSGDKWQRGDLKYIDSDGDGKVDPGKGTLADHGDLKIIGNATPKYSFGINLNVGYKGFEISTLLQGVAKRDFPMAASTYLFGGKEWFKEHLDYFSPENPNGYLPRLTTDAQTTNANTGYNTTRYMLNAAYMRMKNLTVSYTFKPQLLKNIGLSNLKVYFTCDNLFTISKLPNQFDPETLNQVNAWAGGSNAAAPGLTSAQNQNGNGKVYPMNRNFVFGLDFTF